MRRTLLALSAALLLVGIAPAHAPASPVLVADRIPELGRVSTFTATETAHTLIDIPKRVEWRDLHVDYEGNGRIYGFMLFRGDPTRPKDALEGLSIGRCTKRGCKAAREPVRFQFGFFSSREARPGLYDLYVIADGAPVTVTITVKQLSGTVRERVTNHVAADIRTLQTRTDVYGDKHVYSAGDFSELGNGKPDYGFVGMWTMGDAPEPGYGLPPAAVTGFGECFYYHDQRTVPPESIAFAPGCPTADGEPFAFPAKGVVATWSNHTCCPYGLGAYYSTTVDVQQHGAVGMWLEF